MARPPPPPPARPGRRRSAFAAGAAPASTNTRKGLALRATAGDTRPVTQGCEILQDRAVGRRAAAVMRTDPRLQPPQAGGSSSGLPCGARLASSPAASSGRTGGRLAETSRPERRRRRRPSRPSAGGSARVSADLDERLARCAGCTAAKDFEVIANLVNAAPAMGSVDDLLSSLDLDPFSSNLQCKFQV